MKVKFKRLHPEAMIPSYKHIGDGAQDVKAVSCRYNPKYDRFEYGLGFATEFDPKYRARLCARSGNTKTDAYIPNTPGLIDSNYRGEWMFMYKLRTPFNQLFPTGDYNLNLIEMENEMAPFKEGDLIGQIWFEEIIDPEWEEVDELSNTERGADGGLIRDNKDFSK